MLISRELLLALPYRKTLNLGFFVVPPLVTLRVKIEREKYAVIAHVLCLGPKTVELVTFTRLKVRPSVSRRNQVDLRVTSGRLDRSTDRQQLLDVRCLVAEHATD